MKFHKRQLILASLVVALGAAVYLNWQFSDDHGLASTGIMESSSELGEARYVNNSRVEKGEEASMTSAAISDETKKYFAEVQSNRRKAREESHEKLKQLCASAEINEGVKAEISKQTEYLAKHAEQEANIESLIKAKGFSECAAFMQNGECSVVVSPGQLNENSAVIIQDIVSGQGGVPYDKIKITEAK